MKKGEKLFRFLAALILRGFYGTVTIGFEAGKVPHVATDTPRTWQYKDLPEETRTHLNKGHKQMHPSYKTGRTDRVHLDSDAR